MGGGEAGMPSEEELQAALDEQMRRLTVPDVIIQTVVTLINLGARKLGLTQGAEGGVADERNLDEARMAIEGTRALLPLVPAEVGQIREALSQLQMAYAQEARGEAPPTAEGAQAQDPESAPGAPAAAPADDAERAKARAKIWTPGSG